MLAPSFGENLEDASDLDLKRWVNTSVRHLAVLPSDELTRRELKRLKDSIDVNTDEMRKFARSSEKFNSETSSQSSAMIRMTRMITFLTGILVFGLIIQILLVFR